jgi:hypothetical protein
VTTFTPSRVRRGLDALLARYEFFDVVRVEWPPESPWVLVTLGQRSEGLDEVWARWEFAIWKSTGAVYQLDATGAVGDDPLIHI